MDGRIKQMISSIKFFQNDDYLNSSNTTFVWRTWGMNSKRESNPKDDEKFWGEARAHNAYVT
jgi:hypothetical protein